MDHFKNVLGELEKVQTTKPTTSRVVELETVQTASRQQQTASHVVELEKVVRSLS